MLKTWKFQLNDINIGYLVLTSLNHLKESLITLGKILAENDREWNFHPIWPIWSAPSKLKLDGWQNQNHPISCFYLLQWYIGQANASIRWWLRGTFLRKIIWYKEEMGWFRNEFHVFIPKSSIFFYFMLKEILFDTYVVCFGFSSLHLILDAPL